MFIDIRKLVTSSNAAQVKELAGVFYERKECAGPGICKREDHGGDHKQHYWYDEVLLADKVTINKYDKEKKENRSENVWLPIRYYNFCFLAVSVLSRQRQGQNGVETVFGPVELQKTLEACRQRMSGRRPEFIPDGIIAKNYNKLLKGAEEIWKERNAFVLNA